MTTDSSAFGIYILTYPGDYHLSTMLVRSIQHVNADIPIMIIPGEGFDLDNHPFDVPVMPLPDYGFWAEIGHMDRDFWAFQGPFETFLYLDADTIVAKPLDDLVRKITSQDGDFIYVQPWIDQENWHRTIQDPTHPDHARYLRETRSEIGPGPLDEFDPEHNFYAHRSFNAGVFASRRLAIKEADLADLNLRERHFYRERLNITDWTWDSTELFFRDQGRLNYLVHKLSIPCSSIEPELVCSSGGKAIHVSISDVDANALDCHVIHWMGTKSPSPSWFCSGPLFRLYAHLWAFVGRRTSRFVEPGYESLGECTGFSLWRHYYETSHGPMNWLERLRWSRGDLRKVVRLAWRSFRFLFIPQSLIDFVKRKMRK